MARISKTRLKNKFDYLYTNSRKLGVQVKYASHHKGSSLEGFNPNEAPYEPADNENEIASDLGIIHNEKKLEMIKANPKRNRLNLFKNQRRKPFYSDPAMNQYKGINDENLYPKRIKKQAQEAGKKIIKNVKSINVKQGER